MKKLVFIVVITLMMVCCNENEFTEIAKHTNESIKTGTILRLGTIVDIDSCQYIICDAYGGWTFIHHNNCRFCKERRKSELKELVEQLKKK